MLHPEMTMKALWITKRKRLFGDTHLWSSSILCKSFHLSVGVQGSDVLDPRLGSVWDERSKSSFRIKCAPPDAWLKQNARPHSSFFIRSIQGCECASALHQDRAEEMSLWNSSSDRRPPHVPPWLDGTNNPNIRPGLDPRWLVTLTGSTQELRTNHIDSGKPLQKLTKNTTSKYNTCCSMRIEFRRLMPAFVPPNAGCTVSVRKTRLTS